MEINEIISVIMALVVLITGMYFIIKIENKLYLERDKKRIDYIIRELRFVLEETICKK